MFTTMNLTKFLLDKNSFEADDEIITFLKCNPTVVCIQKHLNAHKRLLSKAEVAEIQRTVKI